MLIDGLYIKKRVVLYLWKKVFVECGVSCIVEYSISFIILLFII